MDKGPRQASAVMTGAHVKNTEVAKTAQHLRFKFLSRRRRFGHGSP